jgi:hypothetical protein
MDIQADVGHVVDVLAGDEPDDFTDLAFGVTPGHASALWHTQHRSSLPGADTLLRAVRAPESPDNVTYVSGPDPSLMAEEEGFEPPRPSRA